MQAAPSLHHALSEPHGPLHGHAELPQNTAPGGVSARRGPGVCARSPVPSGQGSIASVLDPCAGGAAEHPSLGFTGASTQCSLPAYTSPLWVRSLTSPHALTRWPRPCCTSSTAFFLYVLPSHFSHRRIAVSKICQCVRIAFLAPLMPILLSLVHNLLARFRSGWR
jgi:hypothetical protein